MFKRITWVKGVDPHPKSPERPFASTTATFVEIAAHLKLGTPNSDSLEIPEAHQFSRNMGRASTTKAALGPHPQTHCQVSADRQAVLRGEGGCPSIQADSA